MGTLCANLEARIVHDEEGMVDAEKGAPGELWERGKTIMKARIRTVYFRVQGYLNNAHATANSITPDGWFKTGDIVVKEDDSFYTSLTGKKSSSSTRCVVRASKGRTFTHPHDTGILRFG